MNIEENNVHVWNKMKLNFVAEQSSWYCDKRINTEINYEEKKQTSKQIREAWVKTNFFLCFIFNNKQ